MSAIYLALGSNLPGDYATPEAALGAALARLVAGPVRLRQCSPLYRTAPMGPAGQPDYVNAVAAVDSTLSPAGLMAYLHQIEHEFGRQRRVVWGPRTLDLDLIDYRGRVAYDWPLLPHPRLAGRVFVLRPLADIAPGWRHPLTGLPISQLLQALPAAERRGLRPL